MIIFTDLTGVMSSHKERRKRWRKKLFEEIIAENSPSLVKHIHLQIQKPVANLKQYKLKEIYAWILIIKLLKIKDEEINVESS